LQDGDFLVRESQGSPGQYVLTGLQSGVKKHLLLVDPEGVVSFDNFLPFISKFNAFLPMVFYDGSILQVRTKDKMFESVSHLINYHSEKNMPIISAESAIVLRHPVYRQGPLRTL
jgi:SHC-transforming protein 1